MANVFIVSAWSTQENKKKKNINGKTSERGEKSNPGARKSGTGESHFIYACLKD